MKIDMHCIIKHTSVIAIVLLLMGCNSKSWLNNREQNEAEFLHQVGGTIDPSQLFITAVNMKVNAIVPSKGLFYTVVHRGKESYVCYQTPVTSDTTMLVTVPQGFSPYVTFVLSDSTMIAYRGVTLTGNTKQEVNIDFTPETTPSISARETAFRPPYRLPQDDPNGRDDLYNPSSASVKNLGYTPFPGWLWRRLDETLPDRQDPELWGNIVNFEFRTTNAVEMSLLMGNNGGTTRRILGYYYHSAGTYADFTMKDIAEVNYHNYVDSVPKALIKHTGSSDWNLVDFSCTYRQEKASKFSMVDSLRGMTFRILDMPEGKMGGFYLKWDTPNAEQYRKLLDIGIPANRLPANMTEVNFTNKQLNVDGRHRCVIREMNDYLILGMEDLGVTGDYDCNDVIFSITPNTLLNNVVDLENLVDSFIGAQPLTWTIAYEDIYRNKDYDFNDVVIRVIPNYAKQTADIYLAAAGTEDEVTLYYDSENGIQELGNLRRLMGGGSYINTLRGQAYVSPVKIATIAWPAYFNMVDDSPRLVVTVHRGECSDDCSDALAVSTNGGQLPSAICVAGEWQWPMEGTSIFETYPFFAEWARRQDMMQYWTWYLK